MYIQTNLNFVGSNQTDVRSSTLNSVGLEQFRLNPFRVLRLTVSATWKEAVWHSEKIFPLARLNLPTQEPDPLPWLPGNEEMEIRQAVQKMEEPLQRIVDQLLWFDFSLDPKGDLLREGLMQVDTQKLGEYLKIKEPELSIEFISSDGVAEEKVPIVFAHCINKANLYLILALSEFHGIGPKMSNTAIPTKVELSISRSITWGKDKSCSFLMNPHELVGFGGDVVLSISDWKKLWTDALNNWYKILNNPHFLSYLKHLFNKLGDEKLDEGAIETISHAVPVRLADILVGEIKNSLNRGTVELVSELVDIAASARFDKRSWNDSFNTLHYFFQSDLSGINCLIEDDTAVSKENIWRYFRRIDEVKLKWKDIDPQDALGLLKLVDDSVLKGLEAIALLDYYGDKLKDVENLLKKAVEIALSNSVQERINTYRSQINQWHQYATCHFCEKRRSDPNYPVVVKGKKETHREYGFNSTTIYYSIKSVIVPRCENCADFHQFINVTSIYCGIVYSFLVIAIIYIVGISGFFEFTGKIFDFISNKGDSGVGRIAHFLITCLFLASPWFIKSVLRNILAFKLTPKGQKSFSDIKKTKTYRELLAEGYFFEKIDSSKNALKKAKRYGESHG